MKEGKGQRHHSQRQKRKTDNKAAVAATATTRTRTTRTKTRTKQQQQSSSSTSWWCGQRDEGSSHKTYAGTDTWMGPALPAGKLDTESARRVAQQTAFLQTRPSPPGLGPRRPTRAPAVAGESTCYMQGTSIVVCVCVCVSVCVCVCVCLCVCVYVHARLRACEGSVLQGLHAPNPCFTDWVFALHHLLGANLFRGNRDKRAKRWQMNACECMRARLCVCVCACASMCVCGCTSVLTPSSIHPPIHHNHHTPSHTA